MYQHILVPFKDEAASGAILPYAKAICATTGAELSLVHVAKDSADHDKKLAELAELASRYHAQPVVAIQEGTVAETIMARAQLHPQTLIAMTTPGHTDAVVGVLGSTTRTIVRASHHPVMVLKYDNRPLDPATFTEVLLPLDGSTLSESMRLEAVSWAKTLGVPLMLIQVLPESIVSDRMLQSLDVLENNYVSSHARTLSREFDVEVNYEVFYGDPAKQITSYLADRTDVLGVIATRGHQPLQAAFVGSVTTKLVRHAGIPLIIQAPKKIGS